MNEEKVPTYRYPRRRFIRGILRPLNLLALNLLSRFEVEGREHIPNRGPLLVVANHFGYVDALAMLALSPWPIEYLGGYVTPNAPLVTRFIPGLYGYYPVFRGTGSREALRAAQSVLNQNGVIGIFPEGGSWASVLRPPRPGVSFLAVETGARILPMGFDGVNDIVPALTQGRRKHVKIRIGEPFGPFRVSGRGRERRAQLDAIGEEVMQRIAALLPDHLRGCYAEDPATREAARGTEIYPYATATETDFT